MSLTFSSTPTGVSQGSKKFFEALDQVQEYLTNTSHIAFRLKAAIAGLVLLSS